MKVFEIPPEFQKTQIAQGISVSTESHPYSRTVSAAVYIPFGTRHEPKEQNGVAHFIEHMVFKGTKSRSAFEIVKIIEAVGGELNAYTSREHTCYHVSVLKEHLNLALDVLLDLVFNAEFTQKEFEKERDVILQEILGVEDQPEEWIYDLYHEKAYDSHALAHSILGSVESLKKLTLSDLKKTYTEFYRHFYVVAAGGLSHEEALKEVQKHLKNRNLKVSETSFKPMKAKAFRDVHKKSFEQVHILMGFPSASYRDSGRYEAHLINTILGRGMTSRLYQNLREEKALVYSIYSTLHSFQDSCLQFFYAATSKDHLEKVISEIGKEVVKLKEEGISLEDLSFFKKQFKGELLMACDDVDERMEAIALGQMVYGHYRDMETILKKVEQVTPESLKAFARDKFSDPGLMILGDISSSQ